MSGKLPRGGAAGRGGRVRRLPLAACLVLLLGACGAEGPPIRGVEVVEVRSPARLLARFPAGPVATTSDTMLGLGRAIAATDEAIFVIDVIRGAVLHLDGDGAFRGWIGRRGGGPGELAGPVGLAVGPDGHVWVADPAGGRLSRFAADGSWVDSYRAPFPVVDFAVSGRGSAIAPTADGSSLFARIGPRGATELPADLAHVPPEISGQAEDRFRLGILLLEALDGGEIAMLRNRHGTDFQVWLVELDASDAIARTRPLPLPPWLYTILGRAVDRVERTMPPEFTKGDFLVPFRGMHAEGSRLWLVPTPNAEALAVSVPVRDGQDMSVVVAGPEVRREMVDAVVRGDRLMALYPTEVRIYALEPVPTDRFRPPG